LNRNQSLSQRLYYFSKWTGISALVGVATGAASALFLLSLEAATEYRLSHPILLFFLPVGGFLVGWLYHRFGKSVEGGNNLIIDEFHDPQKVIPFRMAPLVLIGTIMTHLFGGSAGREGTAVQMGGSIADQLSLKFKMSPSERRRLLMIGMSGGFGSVFGVPFAGTIFGVEVLAIGQLQWWALIECGIAAFTAHFTTLGLGVHHTLYPHPSIDSWSFKALFAVLAAGLAFGLTARAFAYATHFVQRLSRSLVSYLPLRSFLGGAVIALLFYLYPLLTRYAGLGVPRIVESLMQPLPLYDWAGKLGMTALTLGTGFKGGEVTPLLFIGSTLGNALSSFLPLSLPVLTATGFVGVFAGAANTPFACILMAMELFGAEIGGFAALACLISYAISGHQGIYHSQRVHVPKSKQLLFCWERLKRRKNQDL
jgi:H+/Cl- antiporter ClcA